MVVPFSAVVFALSQTRESIQRSARVHVCVMLEIKLQIKADTHTRMSFVSSTHPSLRAAAI